MKRITLALFAMFTLSTTACTENMRARRYGGTSEIEVKAGHKVIGATWKESSLWLLTRPMLPSEAPETLTLVESSSWGVVEGRVLLIEQDSQETARLHKEMLAQ